MSIQEQSLSLDILTLDIKSVCDLNTTIMSHLFYHMTNVFETLS